MIQFCDELERHAPPKQGLTLDHFEGGAKPCQFAARAKSSGLCWLRARSRCARWRVDKASLKSLAIRSLTSPHDAVTSSRWRSRQIQFQHKLRRHQSRRFVAACSLTLRRRGALVVFASTGITGALDNFTAKALNLVGSHASEVIVERIARSRGGRTRRCSGPSSRHPPDRLRRARLPGRGAAHRHRQSIETPDRRQGLRSAELGRWWKDRGTKPVIPNRGNRKQPFSFNRRLSKERRRIENAFGRWKDFRRIATRYDRLAPAWVLAASASASRHRASCMSGFSPSRETIAQPRTGPTKPPLQLIFQLCPGRHSLSDDMVGPPRNALRAFNACVSV